MAGFLYFAPVATPPTLEIVRGWGLAYAFARSPAIRECQNATPSGSKGYLFADAKRLGDHQLRCDLEQQKWRRIPGRCCGKQEIYIGYWRDAKPTPDDLARPEMLSGYRLKLADGNEWQIPVVRAFDEDTASAIPLLPTHYDLDEDGELTRGAVQESHRWLWELTEPAWNAMVSETEVSDQDMLSVAAKLMGANYAVDAVELVGMLGALSPQMSPSGIVSLALDYFTFKRWMDAKKKSVTLSPTDDGCNTPPGEMDGVDVTPQLALTS